MSQRQVYFCPCITNISKKCGQDNMKSLFAKTDKSTFVKLRYLRLKLLKYKENNKKISDTFDHNFKNNLWYMYVMSEVSF